MESGFSEEDQQQQQQCYSVRVSRKERVAAMSPLQEHWLPLSNIDLLVPPVQFDVFSCYKKPAGSATSSTKPCGFSAMVSRLKAALAQTLVSYYALAGEVVTNPQGEPELLCDNRGVEFIEAHAEIELKDLCLYNPDESVEGKLVPTKMEGPLCVQATELKCGGIVVACMFDHRIADAYSANMFLVAWAEAAGEKPISVVPSFRRSLLSARRPGCHDESVDRMPLISSLSIPPPPSDHSNKYHSISRIYCISADDVEEMQADASTGRRSKLVAFSAFLWRVIGKAAAKHAAAAEGCRMAIVVDGRVRLGGSMSSYFGNVLSAPSGILSLDELESMELCRVADEVHDFLSGALTEEHFRGIIDWVEAIRPLKEGAKIYLDARTPFLVVSSGQRFPVGKLDFGWGTPAFSSYYFPCGSCDGYVMPMPMAGGQGHWVVYVHLPSKFIEVLEAEAGHVFRRITSDHLGLTSTVDTAPESSMAPPAVFDASAIVSA